MTPTSAPRRDSLSYQGCIRFLGERLPGFRQTKPAEHVRIEKRGDGGGARRDHVGGGPAQRGRHRAGTRQRGLRVSGRRNHHDVAGCDEGMLGKEPHHVSWPLKYTGKEGISRLTSGCSDAVRAATSAFSNAAQQRLIN
jgi:hypothetical protein